MYPYIHTSDLLLYCTIMEAKRRVEIETDNALEKIQRIADEAEKGWKQ